MNEVIGIPPYLVADPRCVLYLRGDAINGSTRIKDWSPSHKTITVNGNTCNSTAQTKFFPTSIYFDGNGDYLSVPTSTDFNFGTGNYTIMVGVNLQNVSGDNYILSKYNVWTSTLDFALYYHTSSSAFRYVAGDNAPMDIIANTTSTTNTWYQLIVTRNGSVTYLYINGVSVGQSGNNVNILNNNTVLTIGASSEMSQLITGYVDEIAIWGGVAIPISNLYPQYRRMIV